jgi:ComF family protein
MRPKPTGALPTQCEVCRRWERSLLCAGCVAQYALPVARCARCGLRCGQPLARCGACQKEPPPYEATVCVADYGFPWDGLIGALKYHQAVHLAGPMAALLAEAVQREAPAAALPAWVLPIPLSPQRLAERGFNQAALLAQALAHALAQRWPCRYEGRALLRLPEGPQGAHQSELTRAQRLANLRAAFMVDPRFAPALAGARVALVDDVCTTGATAAEATRALLRAGVASVCLWVVARTPAPGS